MVTGENTDSGAPAAPAAPANNTPVDSIGPAEPVGNEPSAENNGNAGTRGKRYGAKEERG